MNESPVMDQVTHFLLGSIFLISTFLILVFGNCLFLETLKANGAKPPPNVFQWQPAKACTCDVLASYVGR